LPLANRVTLRPLLLAAADHHIEWGRVPQPELMNQLVCV
jgi:hypothetical protein